MADTDIASQAGTDGPLPAQPPAPAIALPSLDNGGSGTAPGAFNVTTEPDSNNLDNNFDYEGKHEGKVYDPSTKPSLATYLYLPILDNLCLLGLFPFQNTLWHYLTTRLLYQRQSYLLVADTGATDHMLPDKYTFNSY